MHVYYSSQVGLNTEHMLLGIEVWLCIVSGHSPLGGSSF